MKFFIQLMMEFSDGHRDDLLAVSITANENGMLKVSGAAPSPVFVSQTFTLDNNKYQFAGKVLNKPMPGRSTAMYTFKGVVRMLESA